MLSITLLWQNIQTITFQCNRNRPTIQKAHNKRRRARGKPSVLNDRSIITVVSFRVTSEFRQVLCNKPAASMLVLTMCLYHGLPASPSRLVKARSAIINRSFIALTFSVRSLVFWLHFSACSTYCHEESGCFSWKFWWKLHVMQLRFPVEFSSHTFFSMWIFVAAFSSCLIDLCRGVKLTAHPGHPSSTTFELSWSKQDGTWCVK